MATRPAAAGGSSPGKQQRLRISLAVGVLAALLAAFVVALSGPARAADPLISQGKPVLASSTENAGTPAANAVDGNAGTRWSSAFSDPQWIYVGLGAAGAQQPGAGAETPPGAGGLLSRFCINDP